MAVKSFKRTIKIPSIPEIEPKFHDEFPDTYRVLAAMKERLEVYENRGEKDDQVVKFRDLETLGILNNEINAVLQMAEITLEPTGFQYAGRNADATHSFDNGTHIYTLTHVQNYNIYTKGTKYVKSGDQSYDLSDLITANGHGIYYIYFDTNGNLTASATPWTFGDGLVFTAALYWDDTNNKGFLVDERHGCTMDWATHSYLHHTQGGRYDNGLNISYPTNDGDDGSISISSGDIHDEDLEHNIDATTNIAPFYTINGADFTWDSPGASVYKTAAGIIQYDNSGTLTDVTNNRHVNYYVFATNSDSSDQGIISVVGQTEYITLSAAEEETVNDLTLSNLPLNEFVLLYKIIYKRTAGGTERISTTDLRQESKAGLSGFTANDHGSLSGLTDIADHPGYVTLDGTRPLTANWDAGSYKITAQQVESDIVTGTAPFIVASTTLVTNLNTDYLDGQDGSYYLDSANFTGTSWGNVVFSSAIITDNTIVRGDGGARNVQETSITIDDSDNVGNVNSIEFNTSPTHSHTEGAIHWNADDKCLDMDTEVSGTSIQLGQESVVRCTNKTGGTLSNGKVVYINGAQGNRPTVALADSDNHEDMHELVGIVTSDIADNATGYVTTSGLVRDVDTSSWAAGTLLYASQTAGELTDTAPIPPAHAVHVANVVTQHATEGILLVNIHRGSEISGLHDVILTSLSDNDMLQYNSSTGVWENVAGSTSGYTGDLRDSTYTKIADVVNGLITAVDFPLPPAKLPLGIYEFIPEDGLSEIIY